MDKESENMPMEKKRIYARGNFWANGQANIYFQKYKLYSSVIFFFHFRNKFFIIDFEIDLVLGMKMLEVQRLTNQLFW